MKISLLLMIIFIFIGCKNEIKIQSNNSKQNSKNKTKIDMSSLFDTKDKGDQDELYFSDSKEKIYATSTYNNKLKWINIDVVHSNKKDTNRYKIMSRMVSKKEFLGIGSYDDVMTNVSYEAANNFCSTRFDGALLSTPYIFDHARRSTKLVKQNPNNIMEMIAPVDYEDSDDIFKVDGDKLEVSDKDTSNMIAYHWNTQKYYAVSLSYKSKSMGFRCYK